MMEKVMQLNPIHSRHHVLWVFIIVHFSLLLFSAFSADISPRKILNGEKKKSCKVELHREDNRVFIDNGLVEVTIENPSGHLSGIKYKGMLNVLETRNNNNNKGYWDIVWDNEAYDKLATQHVKIITETDELVELSFTKMWDITKDHGSSVPLNVDKRYIVRRGVPGLYMYGILERQEDFPDAHMYQIRIAFKLNEDKFHFMAVSDTKQRIMPSQEDRDESRCQVLAFKEAVLLTNPTNPQLKGEVDDKYQYSSENKDNKVHGWISDDDAVGFWVITPSNEFRTGGPHKQDLTSHVGPTALSMFVSTHYTGTEMDVLYKKGETWKKVLGPVCMYLNSASWDEARHYRKALWNDANRQLREEIQSWPYNFTASEDFPHAQQRGEVNGQLLVRDQSLDKQLMQAKSAFVGLAAPAYAGSWQTEGKGYQFWTQTDNTGRFTIKNVRPGEKQDQLGYPYIRSSKKWPYIVGNRDSPAEFFIPEPNPTFVNSILNHDADKFRQYGLWDRYSDIYRDGDLVFTVGVSNYSKDWFFAHVPRRIGNETRATTWQIKYELQEVNKAGNYTLQLALAAASYAEVQVRINNPDANLPHFTTERIGYDNAVPRHGIHGLYRLYSINVPGNGFQRGNNTIFLTQTRCHDSFEAVMYDYIRFEGPAV
ncbi:hypothetical protein ES319_D12G086400v1 [Gossypium barbadense]|uniref:Rhamnogalacturonan endolyase n=1 Tax=Gossypium barbadense TaxID=3634 RepID=A0A5J5NWG9_GOSBA|nr:hypothetical protein ES319_D12G086400v1 [Gossypium barbadense]PPD69239.1 hypothetical protein GOBAR_DD33880 [Gossypium barbadense]